MMFSIHIHAFREISCYLESQDLLALWQTNDSRIHALLRNSNAIRHLTVDSQSKEEMFVARAWLQSQEKPRLGELWIYDHGPDHLGISYTYEHIDRYLLRYGEVAKVTVNVTLSSGLNAINEQWSNAIRSRSGHPYVFPGTKDMEITFKHDSNPKFTPISLLDLLPDTLECLTLSARPYAFPSGPLPLGLRNLHTLTLTTQFTEVEMVFDLSLTPAPIFWPHLARGLPLLRSLALEFDIAKPGYWELPPSLTHLKTSFCLTEGVLMILPSTLETLCLSDTSEPCVAQPPHLGILSITRELFWHQVRLSAITSLETLIEIPTKNNASAADFMAYYGETLLYKLSPTEDTASSALEVFIGSHVESTLSSFTEFIIHFPSNLSSLHVLSKVHHEVETTTKAITRKYPHLTKLELRLLPPHSRFRRPPVDLPPDSLSFPSTLTYLQSSFRGDYVSAKLPETLKYLEVHFRSMQTIIDVRQKFGSALAITCIDKVNIIDQELFLAFPETLKGHRVTYQMFLDGLTALLGYRTTAWLLLDESVSWPTGLSILDFEFPQGDLNPSRGISVCLTERILRSPTVTHLKLAHLGRANPIRPRARRGPPIDYPSVLESLEVTGEGAGVLLQFGLWSELPPTLTSLKYDSRTGIRDWSKLADSLPNLTRLDTPNEICILELTVFPTGLRFLSIRFSEAVRDTFIREKLSNLQQLESLTLNASGMILTAPEWSSAVVSRDNVLSGLEAFFAHRRPAFKLEIKDMHRLEVAVQELPQNLTSLDLLCFGRHLPVDLKNRSRWPPKLTSLKTVLSSDHKHGWPLKQFPLTELHAHLDFNDVPLLPATIESLVLTTEACVKRLTSILASLPPELPCAKSLVCLIAPHFSLLATPQAFKPKSASAKPLVENAQALEFPNLRRLVIAVQDCSDADMVLALEKRFPKLERLTTCSPLVLTGALVRDSDSMDVSFEYIALETQKVLLAVLEESYRRRVTKERSSDPSDLKGASKKGTEKMTATAPDTLPDLELPHEAIAKSLGGDLKAHLTCFFTVDAYKTPFELPLLAKRLTLNGQPCGFDPIRDVISFALTIDDPTEIETLIRPLSQADLVHVPSDFSIDSIRNFQALSNLTEVEYDHLLIFAPESSPTHPTLQRLVIHGLIEPHSAGPWTLPPNLTYLEVTQLAESVKFTCAGDESCSNLRSLVLPRVSWKASDALPTNLTRLVVLKFDPADYRPHLANPKCEVVTAS